jgi:hypothetical protein
VLEDDLQRLHVREEEEVSLHRLVVGHLELRLDAEDVVALVAEIGVRRGEHRARQVDHQRRHGGEEHHPHEVGERVHVRRREDVARLFDRRLLELAEDARGAERPVEQDLREPHRRVAREDEQRAARQVAEHVHQHRGDDLVGLGDQLGDVLEADDLQPRHVDHDAPRRHLRQRGRRVAGADVGDLAQRVDLEFVQLAHVKHGYRCR